MAGPLDGIPVVTLERTVAAPLSSCRLADGGARVINFERPEGNFVRLYDRAAKGGSSYFTWLKPQVAVRPDPDPSFRYLCIAEM